MTMQSAHPIIWSVAGIDSGGGAGLAADQRVADSFGVHCCTVVSSITAQSTTEVSRIEAISPSMLQAQLDTLASDIPSCVIKTGLLGSAENVRVLANFVDQLRKQRPLALVVDPVLRASTGEELSDNDLCAAYRDLLLPRATVITPNQIEAATLLGQHHHAGRLDVPAQAEALRELGCEAVVITGGDAKLNGARSDLSHDWIDTAQATGWLSLPRENNPNSHGTGCTFASALACALALGWVVADAAVLAKMATTFSLRRARNVGRGAGPVIACKGFANEPDLLPQLSLDATPPDSWIKRPPGREPGVYAIVGSAERARVVLHGEPAVDTLQLRIKRPASHDNDHEWDLQLKKEIANCQAAADAAGVLLVVNDHWRTAVDVGAKAVHLGQEDLLAMTPKDLADLKTAQDAGLQLGISSHSLWELCRAASLAPALIACGPIWPTNTKDMPWQPQGLDNLRWWTHIAPARVVGIGGILHPSQLKAVAAQGAAGGCLVRGLDSTPDGKTATWQQAWQSGRHLEGIEPVSLPVLPHPTLVNQYSNALIRFRSLEGCP